VHDQTTSAADAFWSANPELLGNENDSSSTTSSRYMNDFEEISLLGRYVLDPFFAREVYKVHMRGLTWTYSLLVRSIFGTL
jgi:hypothetical protein